MSDSPQHDRGPTGSSGRPASPRDEPGAAGGGFPRADDAETGGEADGDGGWEASGGQPRLSAAAARRRWGELVVLFGVAPAALAVVSAKAVVPILLVGTVVVMVVLFLDRSFDRRSLVRLRAPESAPSSGGPALEVGRIVVIWLAAIVLLTPAVALTMPNEFLQMPRERTRLWIAIMLLYPLLSVYPQEVIFRSFFFHRYAPILGSSVHLIAVNALAFGLAHAMFRNGIAVGMTTVGGVLFAWTYARTRSLPLACLEHALYGCFIFTVGLGEFFYTGAVGRE